MELCPLSELRRLSTEPPGFSLGFSNESESVCGEWARLQTWSGLDCCAEGAEKTYSESARSYRCRMRMDWGAYLFWNGTVVSLGYMLSHCLSNRLDFFAEGDARRCWRPCGISETIPIFILKGMDECRSLRKKSLKVIMIDPQEEEEQLTKESSEMTAWAGRFNRSNPPKLQALWYWKKKNPIKTHFKT